MTNFDKYFDGDWFKVMDHVYAKGNLDACDGCPFDGRDCSFLDCSWSMDTFKSWLDEEVYKLKPCPFCGNDHLVFIDNEADEWKPEDGYEPHLPAVCCPIDEGGCGASSGHYKELDDAIKHWNHRCSKEDSDEF